MFKDRFRSARIYRGYTLQKVADDLGMAFRTIQKYDGGDREPDRKLAAQAPCFSYGVSGAIAGLVEEIPII